MNKHAQLETLNSKPITQNPEPKTMLHQTLRAAVGAVNPISVSTSAILVRLASVGGTIGRR